MSSEHQEKNVEYYLSLKYPIQIYEEDGVFTAVHPDLPGSASFGDSIQDAAAGLAENKRLWIEGRLSAQMPIPEPSGVEDYSGRLLLRMSRSLHASLDREAQAEGVSLNQYIVTVLAERHAERRTERLVCDAIQDAHELQGRVFEESWHHSSGLTRYSGEAINLKSSGVYRVLRGRQETPDPGNVLKFSNPRSKSKGYA